MNKTILVLNMGMKSIRSIIFDSKGNKLASAAIPLETSLTGERVTQNPDEWWEKALRVMRETVFMADAREIDYITVTTSAACLVYVDKDCNALAPCIMVSDKRAKEESAKMEELSSFKKLKEQYAIVADPYYLIPKAMWVLHNEPELYEKTYKFLTPNDYLIARLSGRYVTDYINAQKWYCDAKNRKYPASLLQEAGIAYEKMPEIVSPGEFVEKIKKDVAEQIGITGNTKVIATTYDAICSFVGSGTLEEGEASDVSGTVTVFRAALKQEIKKPLTKIQQIPYYEGKLNIIGGSNNLGGGLIEWVKQCYYMNEQLPYEQMEKDAAEAELGAGGVIFLPYLLGERAPIWDNEARGVFFGLERMHTRKEMTRAVFESTGFIDLDMLTAIEETGIKINTIRVSGGLARVGLVSQIKADITGREIHVLSEFETTATGAAMIALYGQGVYESLTEAGDCFAQVRMIIRPNKNNYQKYQELYGLYKETYETIKPLFAKRNRIAERLYHSKKVKIENL